MKKSCTICDRPRLARGYCRLHYDRWKRHGDPHAGVSKAAPNGAPLAFLMDSLSQETDACIEWPFCRHPDGYGKLKYGDAIAYASRVVCTLAHGEPPTSAHEAAHSCCNRPCINKRHLRWATSTENKADMVGHGTRIFGERAATAVLRTHEVAAIRRMLGSKPQAQIGRDFGVSAQTIRFIKIRRTWRHLA